MKPFRETSSCVLTSIPMNKRVAAFRQTEDELVSMSTTTFRSFQSPPERWGTFSTTGALRRCRKYLLGWIKIWRLSHQASIQSAIICQCFVTGINTVGSRNRDGLLCIGRASSVVAHVSPEPHPYNRMHLAVWLGSAAAVFSRPWFKPDLQFSPGTFCRDTIRQAPTDTCIQRPGI